MTETLSLPSTTLYYKDGSSDKVYQCHVEPKGTGFVVNFAFGRRGGTLKTGTKTASPVEQAEALKIFTKLVAEKTAKGYTPGEDGTPYTQTENGRRATEYVPQLLCSIEEEELEQLFRDPGFCAQEKHDGERMIMFAKDNQIAAANKQGLGKRIAAPIEAAFAKLQKHLEQTLHLPAPAKISLDGECMGDKLMVFDILELHQEDLRQTGYKKRYHTLVGMWNTLPKSISSVLSLVETAFTEQEKRSLFAKLHKENREGVVFKKVDAPYIAGRPASGGSQLKFKFNATASCRVASVNQKRSVALELLQNGEWIGVGNVTIPANHEIPKTGDIVEIRYLYAYVGGSLFQPVYLGKRNDVDSGECLINQLKFKADSDS